jgi:hypothetical protein
MTPTGQPAPETAGLEHPTRLFRPTVVSGPDPWQIARRSSKATVTLGMAILSHDKDRQGVLSVNRVVHGHIKT